MKTATDLIRAMQRQGGNAARQDDAIPGLPMFAVMTGDKTCKAEGFNEEFEEEDLVFRQRDLEDEVQNAEIVDSKGSEKTDDDHKIKYYTIDHSTGKQYLKVTLNRKLKKGDEVIIFPIGERYAVLGRVEVDDE